MCGLSVGGMYVINMSLIFQGDFYMSKDKSIFVTIIIKDMCTIIVRVEEIRGTVRGVGKIFVSLIVGF